MMSAYMKTNRTMLMGNFYRLFWEVLKRYWHIHEINSGINIIAGVVHTNSATSEQTAAASEELFNQAEILKKQTSQFKLQ